MVDYLVFMGAVIVVIISNTHSGIRKTTVHRGSFIP